MKLAREWTGNLADFLKDYRYQRNLTPKLDVLDASPFDQAVVNEVVLWKVNRYAPLEPKALAALNTLARTDFGKHRDAETVLDLLLRQPGIDLPMASTLLRFRNPKTFQIIDRRAYRAITGDEYLLYATSGRKKKTDLYFKYLDDLIALAKDKGINFQELDRILYVFDKQENGKL